METVENDVKQPESPEKGTDTEQPKMFTQDELEKHIADRLAKERAKVKKEQDEARKQAEEARKLELLQGEERLKEEFRIQREQIERERDEARMNLAISNAKAELSSRGYSDVVDIAPNLLGTDEEETARNIAAFDKMIQKLVSNMVGQNLNRGTPHQSASATAEPDWKKEMRKNAGL